MKEVLEACMEESDLKFTDDQLNQLTQVLYDDAVSNGSSFINANEGIRFDQLKTQMEKHPGLLENLSIRFRPSIVIFGIVIINFCLFLVWNSFYYQKFRKRARKRVWLVQSLI